MSNLDDASDKASKQIIGSSDMDSIVPRKSDDGDSGRVDMYETENMLSVYLLFHFGSEKELMRSEVPPRSCYNFVGKCADICLEYYTRNRTGSLVTERTRALDVGCSVGRSAFDLSREMDEVVGIDYSHSFIDACNQLKQNDSISYKFLVEGDIYETLKAIRPAAARPENCRFMQGDACVLPENLGRFNIILAANLICRLHTPRSFLNRLVDLVLPGGILVLTSPYTFMREFTPRENWIGSYVKEDGKVFTAFDGLKSTLAASFELLHDEDLWMFMRETARKNQFTMCHLSVWKRLGGGK